MGSSVVKSWESCVSNGREAKTTFPQGSTDDALGCDIFFVVLYVGYERPSIIFCESIHDDLIHCRGSLRDPRRGQGAHDVGKTSALAESKELEMHKAVTHNCDFWHVSCNLVNNLVELKVSKRLLAEGSAKDLHALKVWLDWKILNVFEDLGDACMVGALGYIGRRFIWVKFEAQRPEAVPK
jgi:hypothetical protein